MVCLPTVLAVACGLCSTSLAYPQSPRSTYCRFLPTDVNWPSRADWDALNTTVGGRLLQGQPLAQSCYGPHENLAKCAEVREEWGSNSL